MSNKLTDRIEPSLMPHVSEKTAEPASMGAVLEIHCVSRVAETLEMADRIGEQLSYVNVTKRHINNGHADLLYGAENMPDLVIFFQTQESSHELEEYAKRPPHLRPPLIVIGNADNPVALRAAMKASARDFLPETTDISEIVQSLHSVLSEILVNKREGLGNLVAVINAKGGSGASLLASNVAYMAAAVLNQRTVFVDLDVQFGSAEQYLDTHPRHGLLEALHMANDLDEVALGGYVVKHKSGLDLLSSESCDLLLEEELTESHLCKLLDLLMHSYQQVIVDIPRHIDPFSITLLERADCIAVVVQQYITNIRDATRLLHILTTDLGIDSSRIHVVVNRYQNNAEINLHDIRHTLDWSSVTPIPNDFRTVNESLNRGMPLYELSRHKPIARAVQTLGETLTEISLPARPNMLSRIKSWF